MTEDGWFQFLTIKYDAMFTKENAKLFGLNVYNNISIASNGSWKPIGFELNEFEIKIKCRYIEGETYNGKD